jgi:hypothetical protein
MAIEGEFDFYVVLDGLSISIPEREAALIVKENRTSFLELHDPAFTKPYMWENLGPVLRPMIQRALREKYVDVCN